MSFAPAPTTQPVSPAAAVLAAMAPTPAPQPVDDTEARAMEIATELRANGAPRSEIITQLAVLRVSETAAHYLVNQVDLFAGMMGRPHPMDIDPQVRARIDKQGPMMMTTPAPTEEAGPTPGSKAQIVEQARSMAAQGYPLEHIVQYLTEQGAPEDQANRLAYEIVDKQRETSNPSTSKRGRFRRK